MGEMMISSFLAFFRVVSQINGTELGIEEGRFQLKVECLVARCTANTFNK